MKNITKQLTAQLTQKGKMQQSSPFRKSVPDLRK